MPRKLICIIGRGNSGTRIIPDLLVRSGVYMGECNESMDHVGIGGKKASVGAIYDACAEVGRYAKHKRDDIWDFSEMVSAKFPDGWVKKVSEYLRPVLDHKDVAGWKLPECTLAYPWLVKLFPNAYFIYVLRHPMDSIAKKHPTDYLYKWHVETGEPAVGIQRQRALSWAYQYDIVHLTPRPMRFLKVHFEDMVNMHEGFLLELALFLDIDINDKGYKWHKAPVERWEKAGGGMCPNFLRRRMKAEGYDI